MNTISRTSTLEEIVDNLPIPDNAVFMGMAEDGKPILFDVLNPSSPNILIWNGSVDILKVIAEYIMRVQKGTRRKTDIEFLVLTSNPDKWKFLYGLSADEMKQTPCIAVAPIWSDLADQLILSLASWIHGANRVTKTVLVLVDDVSKVQEMDFHVVQNMRYVLQRGGRRSVFVIGTSQEKEANGFDTIISAEEDGYRLVCNGEDTKFWLPTTVI